MASASFCFVAPFTSPAQKATLALLPGPQLVELGADEVGQDDLPNRRLAGSALEHTERDPAPGPAVVLEHLPAVEGQQLVLRTRTARDHC